MFNELMAISSNLDGNKWTSSGVITPVFETAAKKNFIQPNVEAKSMQKQNMSRVENVYSHEIAGQLLC